MAQAKFYTAGDIAEIMHVSRPRAYQLIAQGVIPAVRYQKLVRVPVRLFEEWLALQERTALADQQAGTDLQEAVCAPSR